MPQSIDIETTKILIDGFINNLIDSRIKQAEAIHPNYTQLWKEISRVYNAGGKRLRPYISLLTYQVYGGKNTKAFIPTAAALELLHLSLLIHDDIIDRDTTRHGTKNIIGHYLIEYKNYISKNTDQKHFAQSSALLAGDLLIAEAHKLISSHQPKSLQTFHNIIFTVIGGQLLDTEASFMPAGTIDPDDVMSLKTASYSFVGPMLIGAEAADATKSEKDKLTKLGKVVGIGFQLQDDLLGVFGHSAKSGKSTENDLKEGKQTSLVMSFYGLASKEQITQFNQIFNNSQASGKQISLAKNLLESVGAKKAIRDKIKEKYSQAKSLIDQLNISDKNKSAYLELVDKSLNRDH